MTPYNSQNAQQWRSRPVVGVKCSGPSITGKITWHKFSSHPHTLLSAHVCIPSYTESCTTDGDVRLVGGSTEREGHVELCLDGIWGDVCNLSLLDLDAVATFADVVCNQIGYPTKCKPLTGM